jgi:signal transduction histidine kinase
MKIPGMSGLDKSIIQLFVYLGFIALITVAGIFIFEQVSSVYFHGLMFMGAHIITIVMGGLLATLASLFVIMRFQSLYRDILIENAERRKAESELQDAKEQGELYLDILCHDINNMNTVALGFIELADDKLKAEGRLDVCDRRIITKTIESLLNSSTLIDNVRKLRREKEGVLKAERMDVMEILASVRDQFTGMPDRDVRIDIRSKCRCFVMANELLRDVFSNLVGNSIKHSTGPLAINIDLACSAEGQEHFCQVAIEDNGPGIPDSMKAQIMGVRRRITKGQSRGIGMYLVRTLIDDYHGQIRVEDRVKGDHTKGTRFVVSLPAVE